MSIYRLRYVGKDIYYSDVCRVTFVSDTPEAVLINVPRDLAESLEEDKEYFVDTEQDKVLTQANLLTSFETQAQELYDQLALRHPPTVASEIISELRNFHNFWGEILADVAYSVADRYEDNKTKLGVLNLIETYYAPLGGKPNEIQS